MAVAGFNIKGDVDEDDKSLIAGDPLDQVEEEEEGVLINSSAKLVLVTETSSTFIQEALRESYFIDLTEGDLILISGIDRSQHRMKSQLLAAVSPFFADLLLPQSSLEDDIRITIADASGLELENFIKQIYFPGKESADPASTSKPSHDSSFLSNFITFHKGHSKPPTNESDYPRSGDELRQVEGGDDQFEVEENVDHVKHEQERKTLEFKDVFDELEINSTKPQPPTLDKLDVSSMKNKDIRRLMGDEAAWTRRVALSALNTSSQEINHSFKQICIDDVRLQYLQCNIEPAKCRAILKLPRGNNGPFTALTRHVAFHTPSMEDDDTENISPVNEESLESSESMKDAKKPSNIPANGDAAPMTTPENNAVEAGSDHAEISKPVSQTTPPQGVSKFAVEKLMQTNSSRVQFERCNKKSRVWKRFSKVLLDKVELPLVSCISCTKLYAYDRSLGTSTLLRHACAVKPTDKDRLPRLVVQELVNTADASVSMTSVEAKLDQKLTDLSCVYERVVVDNERTEYICCRHCAKLLLMPCNGRPVAAVLRKAELHDCYLKHAPSSRSIDLANPQNEMQLKAVMVRQPERIRLLEPVKEEPYLSYVQVDNRRTSHAYCSRCLKFIPLASLNFKDGRLHRCQKQKSNDHTIRAVNKRTFLCDHCNNEFKSEHFLEIHVRRDHRIGSPAVICTHCAKSFPTERLAKKHEAQVHHPETSKKFRCTFKDCTMRFHDRHKLGLHAATHNTTGQKPYVCDQCGKGFNSLAAFKDHSNMHTGTKKYTCEYCQRQFTKRNTLNNHRRLHTGEKPFLCPATGCGKSFVQRTACKTHARKKHGITITKYTRNTATNSSNASSQYPTTELGISSAGSHEAQVVQYSTPVAGHHQGGIVVQYEDASRATPKDNMQLAEKQEIHQIESSHHQQPEIRQLERYQVVQAAGGRLLVDSHQLEHVEVGHLIARTFHQGQTVEIAQLAQGQLVQIIQPVHQVEQVLSAVAEPEDLADRDHRPTTVENVAVTSA